MVGCSRPLRPRAAACGVAWRARDDKLDMGSVNGGAARGIVWLKNSIASRVRIFSWSCTGSVNGGAARGIVRRAGAGAADDGRGEKTQQVS